MTKSERLFSVNQNLFLNNRLTFLSEDKLFDVEYQVDNDDMSTQSAYDYDTDSSMEICLSINLSKYNFAAIVLNRQLTPDEKCELGEEKAEEERRGQLVKDQ